MVDRCLDITLTADKGGSPVALITTTGTYSLSGSTLTVVGDDGETETFTISNNGNRLTLENDEIKLVLEKQ